MAAQASRNRVLRIGIVQEQQIVQEQLIRDQKNVTVGESTKNTFVLPPSSLPKRFPLFVTKGAKYFLQFTDEMKGRVSIDGKIISLADLKTGGQAVRRGPTWIIPVPETSRGKVVIDNVSILFQFVPRPPEPIGAAIKMDFRPRFIEAGDPVFYGFLAVFAALAVCLTVFAHTTELAPAATVEEMTERFADLLLDEDERDEPDEPDEPEETDPDGTEPSEETEEPEETEPEEAVAEVEQPERQQISEEERQRQRELAEARQRAADEAAADAMVAQLLGTLGENNSGGTTRDFGDQFGREDMDAMLANSDRMEASTSLEARAGETANREAVDLGGVSEGAVGTADIDAGPSVTVDGMIDLGSADIEAVAGEAGGVTSVVRRYKNRLKLCYDQALRRDPQLSGRVEIFFMVGDGRVLESAIEGNTTHDSELGECILRKVNALTFDVDVEAEVVYPFILSAQ